MVEENFCMVQGFEWNVPTDQKHWIRLKSVLQHLKDTGIDNIWIPPACKGAGGSNANGYDLYDLWDLGEFDQKGGKATKWGTKEELVDLCNEADKMGVGIYFDAVINHKTGADEKEKCAVQAVDPDNRLKDVGEPREMEAWLGFTFPGREDKYSSLKWRSQHFSGTDWDAENNELGIWRIVADGKYWSSTVGEEHGNNDFLMCADIDFSHPEVEKDVLAWAVWVVKELKLKGIRFDACKHFSQRFTNDLVATLDTAMGKKDALFLVGEYCTNTVEKLIRYLDRAHGNFHLFDQPLVTNFSRISTSERADLRQVFDRTLVQLRPTSAVTFVMSHDTQPGQAVATKIEPYFKPLAYALILLRAQGYPAIFYGDLYGMQGEHPEPPSCDGQVPSMALTRKLFAYGSQEDYWNHPNCIGFVRRGTPAHPHGLACVLSNAEAGEIRMAVGEEHRGEVWSDVLGWMGHRVTIGEDGYGVFACHAVSVSIWVMEGAPGRERFGKFDADIYAKA